MTTEPPPKPARKRRRVFLALFAVITAGFAALALFFARVMIWSLTPRVAFDPAHVPAPPDYANPAMWSARPEGPDASRVRVAILGPVNPAEAIADVFYVHPTSYVANGWNASLDDATVNRATDRGATRIQASAFHGCCAVYAPRYRQANLTAFTHPTADGARAIDLGTTDVIAAFRYYLDHDNHGRPFVIAGHSQGSVHAYRLLRDVISGSPLRERLVAAYLIGGPISDRTARTLTDIPVCDSPAQTGCLVAWNARNESYTHGLDFVEGDARPDDVRVCVNPLTWRRDETFAASTLHRGAVFFGSGDDMVAPVAAFTTARCHRGTLIVAPAAAIPRDFMSHLLDYAIGTGNYHPVEYGMFYGNIWFNARERVEAFRAAHAAAPVI